MKYTDGELHLIQRQTTKKFVFKNLVIGGRPYNGTMIKKENCTLEPSWHARQPTTKTNWSMLRPFPNNKNNKNNNDNESPYEDGERLVRSRIRCLTNTLVRDATSDEMTTVKDADI